jgi:hypothetical protein
LHAEEVVFTAMICGFSVSTILVEYSCIFDEIGFEILTQKGSAWLEFEPEIE